MKIAFCFYFSLITWLVNSQVVNIENSRQLILQWSAIHQISSFPSETIHDFKDKNDFVNFVYNDIAGNEIISFLEVKYLSL